jgi:hypothetical protein
MTTSFNKTSLGGRAARAAVFGLLAMAATLLQAREAHAQWTQPDAAGNINTTNTGNVGVGTTTPPYTVSVVKDQVGTTAVGVFNSADGPATLAAMGVGRVLDWSDKFFTFGVTSPSFGVPGLNDVGIMHTKGVPLKFGSESAHDLHFFTNGYNSTRMLISGAGNVGIGTTEPGSKMVISANAATPLAPNPGNPNVLAPQDGTILHIVNADTQKTRVTIDSFGNTAGPSVSFRSGRGTLAAPAATLSGDALGIVYGGGFGVSRFHNGAKPAMWMVATENWTDTAAGSAIFFNTVPNGATVPAERMRISNDGKVGIGTTAPATALHVVGDMTITGTIAGGNITAKYQDVAEWVPSTQKLAAGTVVALDRTLANHVVASATAYDTRVAGVISPQPGIALGEKGEGKVLVATTGRVKVRVDATRAPIQIGDLIVTSGASGVAMKSEPVSVGGVEMHRPGTLIGKALESLEKGTGEILVLLSLQ